MTVIACPTGGSFIRGKDSRVDADVDSSTKALLVKEVSGAVETVKISRYTTTDIFHAQVDVGTTEVQLTTETDCLSITIKADDDNTDDIYIGKSGVTTSNGFRLRPGQAITIFISNPSVLYAISGTAGQKVHILGEK